MIQKEGAPVPSFFARINVFRIKKISEEDFGLWSGDLRSGWTLSVGRAVSLLVAALLRGLTCHANPTGVATRRFNPYFVTDSIMANPLYFLSDRVLFPRNNDQRSKTDDNQLCSWAFCS
ncbi:hypothetical protein HMPREF9372_0667 [Sporosarcina newyorkensis 2681]|uniref:Uncharacterized protein n=2 Tax=Sporosarcina newyorkensis TaxID=759851 RepID=A0A1T4YFP7_9BACL|nr:hypothetical protein HMPREF9372_0667 [Sporosarcina newyorkensis 2681]SKB00111.1 hypothetical protein SAMN04244570_2419 [Sporosarcina newyorkensis]